MWPKRYYDWRGEGMFSSVFWATRGWLAGYPVLAPEAPRLAYAATERAFDLAEQHLDTPGRFVNADFFRRWVNQTTGREALRLVLEVERVRALLGEVHDVSRQLLFWYYTDQLTLSQIAAVLFGDPKEAERAGEAVRRAYNDLCGVLQAHHLARGRWTFPR
jgi:hypothetical protein